MSDLRYGFPTVFGRGLYDEFKHFVNPPFLVVTMHDLWELFAHQFSGAECRDLLPRLPRARRPGARCGRTRRHPGGGRPRRRGQALDVAKFFAWRRRLPLFQAPTALSVNAVYGQRSGRARGGSGRVPRLGGAAGGVHRLRRAESGAPASQLVGHRRHPVFPYRGARLALRGVERQCRGEVAIRSRRLARQSLVKVEAVLDNVDAIRRLDDEGIRVLVDGLKWGTSFHGVRLVSAPHRRHGSLPLLHTWNI